MKVHLSTFGLKCNSINLLYYQILILLNLNTIHSVTTTKIEMQNLHKKNIQAKIKFKKFPILSENTLYIKKKLYIDKLC